MFTVKEIIPTLVTAFNNWEQQEGRAVCILSGTEYDHVYTVTEYNNKIVIMDVKYNELCRDILTTHMTIIEGNTIYDIVDEIKWYVKTHCDDYVWLRTGIWPITLITDCNDSLQYYILADTK